MKKDKLIFQLTVLGLLSVALLFSILFDFSPTLAPDDQLTKRDNERLRLKPRRQVNLAEYDPHSTSITGTEADRNVVSISDHGETVKYSREKDWLGLWRANVARNSAGYPETIGDYSQNEVHPEYTVGETVRMTIPGLGRIAGQVTVSYVGTQHFALGFAIDDTDGGTGHFEFDRGGQLKEGLILSRQRKLVYSLSLDEGKLKVRVAPKSEFIPDEPEGLPHAASEIMEGESPEEGADGAEGPIVAESAPLFESNPGAAGVVYLDFDGQTVEGSLWNTFYNNGNPIVVPDLTSSWSNSKIEDCWIRVADDFRPFTVNVTTSEAVFNSTPINQRIRVLMSSYSSWFGSAGGVAYYNSWSVDNRPAWVFTNQLANSSRYAAEAVSHEVGHSLSLRHDGRTSPSEGYYRGHGNWAPIMGVGYYKTVSQWSKGEYLNADNAQDDLVDMRNFAGVDYRNDLHGNTFGTAANLSISGTVINDSGIIERNTDIDVFAFETGAGNVSISLQSTVVGTFGNLNIKAQVYRESGEHVATSNETDTINASFSNLNLDAGRYYLKVDGAGELDPLTTGYSDYGSLGEYTITGEVVAGGVNPTPTPTINPTPTPTPEPTPTSEPTSTQTPQPSPTQTPRPTATQTPQPTNTQTPQPTATSTPAEERINFLETPPGRYGGRKYSKRYKVKISSDGYSLSLSGQTWQRIAIPSRMVSTNDVLEFSYTIEKEGRILAIGFENDTRPNESRFFQLAGSQRWGNQDYNDGCGVVCGATRVVRIPFGLFLARTEITDIVIINERGEQTLADLRFIEQEASNSVAFNSLDISAYGGRTQSVIEDSTIFDAGETLTIGGNTWNKIPFAYEVTKDTVLEFNFQSIAGAELQGIGFDTDAIISPDKIFKLAGSQEFGIEEYEDATDRVVIPVGDYYTGKFNYMVFVNDDDSGSLVGRSFFETVRVFERVDGASAPSPDIPCEIEVARKTRRKFVARIRLPAIAVGENYLIMESADGGEHWSPLKAGVVDKATFRKRFRVKQARNKVFKVSTDSCTAEVHQKTYNVATNRFRRGR